MSDLDIKQGSSTFGCCFRLRGFAVRLSGILLLCICARVARNDAVEQNACAAPCMPADTKTAKALLIGGIADARNDAVEQNACAAPELTRRHENSEGAADGMDIDISSGYANITTEANRCSLPAYTDQGDVMVSTGSLNQDKRAAVGPAALKRTR